MRTISDAGPHPDGFTIRQPSADSDYAVARRAEEATDFAGTEWHTVRSWRRSPSAFKAASVARLDPEAGRRVASSSFSGTDYDSIAVKAVGHGEHLGD